jgi:hypothetical protein
MELPPEVRALVKQLQDAGMDVDENNPEQVMQLLMKMGAMKKKKADGAPIPSRCASQIKLRGASRSQRVESTWARVGSI